MTTLANLTTYISGESQSFLTALDKTRGGLRSLISSLDPVATATARYNRQVDLLDKGLRNNQLTLEQHATLTQRLSQRYQDQIRGQTAVTTSTGSMRQGMQQLSFQMGDVATQFASGTKASVIFAQQSGQVIQAIQLMTGGTSRLATFLGGPWGIAISSAAIVLSPFIGRLFETGDAADAAKAKLDKLKQAMDRVSVGRGAGHDVGALSVNRIELQSQLASVRGRLGTDTLNTPLPGELRNVLRRQEKELLAKIAEIDSSIRIGSVVQQKIDPLTVPDGSAGGGARSSNPTASRIQRVREEADLAIPSIEQMADALGKLELSGGFQDESTLLGDRAKGLYSQFGINPEEYKQWIDMRDKAREQRGQEWEEWLQAGRERVTSIANFFEDAMTGAGGSFLEQFKRIGIRAAAEIAARLITNNGGQGGNIGSIIGSVVSSAFKLPGFASGGSFQIGGSSGVDRNILSINGYPAARVSRGETVNISNGSNDNSRVTVHVVAGQLFDAIVDGRAVRVAAPMAQQAVVGGAALGESRITRRSNRRLA